jgi:hypothetical protein
MFPDGPSFFETMSPTALDDLVGVSSMIDPRSSSAMPFRNGVAEAPLGVAGRNGTAGVI